MNESETFIRVRKREKKSHVARRVKKSRVAAAVVEVAVKHAFLLTSARRRTRINVSLSNVQTRTYLQQHPRSTGAAPMILDAPQQLLQVKGVEHSEDRLDRSWFALHNAPVALDAATLFSSI